MRAPRTESSHRHALLAMVLQSLGEVACMMSLLRSLTRSPGPTPAASHGPAPSPAPTPAIDMSNYYAGGGGGCFAASALVARVTGDHVCPCASCSLLVSHGDPQEVMVPIASLRKGHAVRVHGGGIATVLCLVRIARSPNKAMVSLPGGLLITPDHPISVDGIWTTPRVQPGVCARHSVLRRVYACCPEVCRMPY